MEFQNFGSLRRWLQSKTAEIAMQYGYIVPAINIVSKSKSFGRCYPSRGEIRFSYDFIQKQSEEAVIALIKHEVCHLKYRLHDARFERACKEMGIKKHTWMQCYVVGVSDNDFWHPYECPVCYKMYYYREKLERGRSCVKCNPEKFDERFKLVYKGDEKFRG